MLFVGLVEFFLAFEFDLLLTLWLEFNGGGPKGKVLVVFKDEGGPGGLISDKLELLSGFSSLGRRLTALCTDDAKGYKSTPPNGESVELIPWH